MTKDEYEALCRPVTPAPARVFVSDLADQRPRTLLYGYTCERDTFHVYLGADGLLHKVVYGPDKLLLAHEQGISLVMVVCVPDKRVYPHASDLEFCTLLAKAGVSVPFTTFTEGVEPRQFYGEQREALVEVDPSHLQPTALRVSLEELGLESLRYEYAYGLEEFHGTMTMELNRSIKAYVRAVLVSGMQKPFDLSWFVEVFKLLYARLGLGPCPTDVSGLNPLLEKARQHALQYLNEVRLKT